MRIRCYFAHPEKLKNSSEKMDILKELISRQLIVIDPFRNEDEILAEFGVDKYWGNEYWELARRIWTKDLDKSVLVEFLLRGFHRMNLPWELWLKLITLTNIISLYRL